jgi:hypothetical protein
MATYAETIWSLKEPIIGGMLDTPQSKQDWKRFFGMMDTLERNEIAIFQNGRYLLHPKRKADVVEQAEEVLAEISKPLTLPPDSDSVVAENATVEVPQFNACPSCTGKGRVNIEDALGYFGNFLCLTCYGEGQLPVPSRSTFPPVDLSKKPEPPNAVLFSSNAAPVVIPQALEVGGVRVIVEAPALVAEPVASKNDCDTCEGYGTLVINNIEQTCTVCNGTGEKVEISVVDSPSSELIATLAPLAALALGDTRMIETAEVPAVGLSDDVEEPFTTDELDIIRDLFAKAEIWETEDEEISRLIAADCPECQGLGVKLAPHEALGISVKTCQDCGGSGEMQELPLMDVFPDSPSDELITPVLSIPAPTTIEAAEAIVRIIAPIIAAPSKSEIEAELAQIAQHEASLAAIETSDAVKKECVILKTYPRGTRYVRVDWSKRGLSSGRFEILSIMRQYGRTWWMVTLWHVDKEGNPYPYQFPVSPDTKRIEMVVE